VRSIAFLLAAAALAASAATPRVPASQGFVTDTTGTVSTEARQRMTRLIQELQQKTGAEIAVLVVDTTAPLDGFDYALQVAEDWKPGKKGEDNGVVVLLALKDRKLRILTGYGVEGILPDGLVGEIQDREMLPALRQGNVDEALWRGVAEIANRIAAEKGVTLTGLPERRRVQGSDGATPVWVLLLVLLLFVVMSRYARRPGWRGPVVISGGGGFHGGFGGGGGGFGGFGGGSFGGGGAGRSW